MKDKTPELNSGVSYLLKEFTVVLGSHENYIFTECGQPTRSPTYRLQYISVYLRFQKVFIAVQSLLGFWYLLIADLAGNFSYGFHCHIDITVFLQRVL